MSECEASHYTRGPEGTARCRLCPHRCDVPLEGRGRCGVRENLGGILYARNFEELARVEAETVERVPLFHFLPGAPVLTISSFGESFPAELAAFPSMEGAPSRWASAHEVIDIAVSRGARAIACAGGEPFMWFEEWREIASLARAEGLLNVAATNGFALEPAVREIAPLLDALNVSLLGSDDEYRRRAAAPRDPVVDAIRSFRTEGVHVELTLLLLAGEDPAAWVASISPLLESLGPAPLHVSSPLSPDTAAAVRPVHSAAALLAERFPHVYVSPIYGSAAAETCCRTCKCLLVRRLRGSIEKPGLAGDGSCARCGAPNGFRM